MYAKYHTEAIVLGSTPRGEQDKTVTLYTRDFGLVRARASAIRSERSKMRYALQNYSIARISLVRGTSGWRAAGAQQLHDALKSENVRSFARIASLVERLVTGEEKNERLYVILADTHDALRRVQSASVELLAVARVLYTLGYLSSESLGSALFLATAYSEQELEVAEKEKKALLASVNRALSETHL